MRLIKTETPVVICSCEKQELIIFKNRIKSSVVCCVIPSCFYTSTLATASCFHPFHFYEPDSLRTPWGNVLIQLAQRVHLCAQRFISLTTKTSGAPPENAFNFGSNIHFDSRMTWRSKSKIKSTLNSQITFFILWTRYLKFKVTLTLCITVLVLWTQHLRNTVRKFV